MQRTWIDRTGAHVIFEGASWREWRELSRIAHANFPRTPVSELGYAVRNLTAGTRIARIGREIVGYTMMGGGQPRERIAWLEQIAVVSGFRERGIGRALLEDFEIAAARRGYRRVELAVEKGNDAAVELYRRGGYQQADRPGAKDTYWKILSYEMTG